MASVDEVLATMSEEDVSTSNIDEVLVIDPNTRQINIPGSELILGVESDTHSERKYFQCPRYVGNGIDLASCFIRVNFRNANGDIDAYLVNDVVATGDMITFSWELSRKVTQYMGQVKFLVCCNRPGGNGVGPKEWHTTQATGVVLVGLEPDSVVVETASEDAITALLTKVDAQSATVEAVGASEVAKVTAEGTAQVSAVKTASEAAEAAAVAEIEAKGVNVRASIPDDYTAVQNAVDTLTRSRGGVIVCEATGGTVVVNDASDLPMQGLRVFGKTTQVTTTGKNLLDTNHTATFLNNESREKTGVVVPIDTDGVYSYYVGDSVTVYIGYTDSFDSTATHYASAMRDKPAIGTIDLKAGQYFLLWFDTGVSVRDSSCYSLTLGTEITREPYTGGKPSPSPDFPQELVSLEPVVTVTGKNLFDIETLRVTLQEDGSYLLPSYPKKPMVSFPKGYAGQMTISGWIKYDSVDNRGGYIIVLYTDGTDDRVGVINSSLDYQRYEFTTKADKIISEIGVSYGVGTVATYFKDVQVEFGRVATAYEPYCGQTLPVTHTLPGIPVTSGGNYTDRDGQQWVCDEVDLGRGVYVQRMGRIEFDGSEPWNGGAFSTDTSKTYVYLMGGVVENVSLSYCTHATFSTDTANWSEGKYMRSGGGLWQTMTSMSVSEWSAYLLEQKTVGTPVTLHYPLSNPIETPLSETEIAAYRAMHTNYPNTTVLNDSGAHMVVKYAADTKLYIDKKIVEALQ